jgi:hypothetical protein
MTWVSTSVAASSAKMICPQTLQVSVTVRMALSVVGGRKATITTGVPTPDASNRKATAEAQPVYSRSAIAAGRECLDRLLAG